MTTPACNGDSVANHRGPSRSVVVNPPTISGGFTVILRTLCFIAPLCLALAVTISASARTNCPSPYSGYSCNSVCTDETGEIRCDEFDQYDNRLWAVTDGNNPFIWGYIAHFNYTEYFCCKQADVGYKDELAVRGHDGADDEIKLVYSTETWEEDSDIYTYDGDDTVYGGNDTDYSDLINGGAGADTVYGYAGDDHLLGGVGADYLSGMQGDDTLECGGRLGCEVHGGDGDDTITGTTGSDDLAGDGGQDDIYGLGGNDRLCAGSDSWMDGIDGGLGSGDWCYLDNDEDAKSGCDNIYDTEGYCPF